MTTTIVFANASDGRLISTSASYATARSGGSFTASAAETTLPYGHSYNGPTYGVAASFVQWPYTPPVGEVVTSAAIRLYHVGVTSASVSRDLEIRQHDWGTAVEAADWVPADGWANLPLLASALATQTATGKYVHTGSQQLVTLMNTGSTTAVKVMLTSKNARTGQTPTADEVSTVSAVDEAGTANDPTLIYTTVPKSTLYGVLGAQVRMADGAWCALESDGVTPTPAITLRRYAAGAVTTIGTLAMGGLGNQFAGPQGAQGFALATDSADRVYVVGRIGNAPNALMAQAFTRSGGTWTGGPVRLVSLPSYGGTVNNVAATCFNTGDAYGELYVVVGHGPDAAVTGGGGNDLAHVRLSGEAIVTGTGTTVIASGSALGSVQPERTKAGAWNTYANEVGTGLDVATPGSGRIAYVVSFPKGSAPGDLDQIHVGRGDYDALLGTYTASSAYGVKDGAAKLRVIPTGSTTLCVVAVDRVTGITVVPYQAVGGTWTRLAEALALDLEAVPSMPAPATVATAQTWDAVYHAPSNKLWIYYCPTADRTVRRTSVDLSTYRAVRDSITVATVGAVGGTNLAVRASRNEGAGSTALITVAHKASGGTLSTVYAADSLNQAPTAPILAARSNFDATTANALSWAFTDPDPSDTQSAYELEIVNVGTGVTAVATGKVVSTLPQRTIAAGTLTNGVNYQWRVRTYDSSDVVGPWSGYGSFSTAAGGTVTITNPATDNPPGVVTDDYAVTWSVAGTVQASYRVEVVRVNTGAVLLDTGYLASTATSHTIAGMLSDVEYEIRVTVRNSSAVTSNTGTRRITPSYATPETPAITVTDRGEFGYMLVQVDNPASGELPGGSVVHSFETDVAALTSSSTSAAQSNVWARTGTYSAKLTVLSTPAISRIRSAEAPFVVAGQRYTASFWAYHPTGASNVICTINWRPTDPAGGTISSSSGSGFTLPAGVPTLVFVTANAPAGAERCVYGPGFSVQPSVGFEMYTDDWTFALASDRPAATGNEVYRRELDGAWSLLGAVALDGQYRDYAAASGVAYEYKARALAGGPYSDSAAVAGTLALEGVWLHDPLDPVTTVRQLRFGSAMRSGDLDVVGSLTHYAGRALPVADIGEHETESVRVAAVVPFGPDWSPCVTRMRAAIRLRRPLIMRDNRGRAVRGILSGYQESDQRYGTQVSFAVSGTDGGV